ncbi:MAG TPA: hypothetical protein VGM90_36710 [Kofleriaceae bacterium]|jgi:hypothetical protein
MKSIGMSNKNALLGLLLCMQSAVAIAAPAASLEDDVATATSVPAAFAKSPKKTVLPNRQTFLGWAGRST